MATQDNKNVNKTPRQVKKPESSLQSKNSLGQNASGQLRPQSRKMANLNLNLDQNYTPPVQDLVDVAPKKPEPKDKKTKFNLAKPKHKDNPLTHVKKREVKNRLKSESVDLMDLEDINEKNLKQYRFRSRRNRVLIIILSLLLAITIISISIYAGTLYLDNNCRVYVSGSGNASAIVEGREINRFRVPAGFKGNIIYEVDLDLKIKQAGEYNINFRVRAYMNGNLLNNTLIYEPDREAFVYRASGDYYSSKAPIKGDRTINLFGGIIIDRDYEYMLNENNFEMRIYVELQKV